MAQAHRSKVVNSTTLLRLALFSVPCALLGLLVWTITQSLPMTIGISVAIWTALVFGGLAQQQLETPDTANLPKTPKS